MSNLIKKASTNGLYYLASDLRFSTLNSRALKPKLGAVALGKTLEEAKSNLLQCYCNTLTPRNPNDKAVYCSKCGDLLCATS